MIGNFDNNLIKVIETLVLRVGLRNVLLAISVVPEPSGAPEMSHTLSISGRPSLQAWSASPARYRGLR